MEPPLWQQILDGLTDFADAVESSGLDALELARLSRVRREWPAEMVEQGLREELVDILAARELAAKPPLTVEQVDRARRYFAANPPPEQEYR